VRGRGRSFAPENYHLALSGTVTQVGTIAVQPSSTTSLRIASDALTVTGTVYDPPSDYHGDACPTSLTQDGGHVSGTLCGREVGLSL
jgi:hypothetical protein